MLGHTGLQGIVENTCGILGGAAGLIGSNLLVYYLSNDWQDFTSGTAAVFLPVTLPVAGLGFVYGWNIGEKIYYNFFSE